MILEDEAEARCLIDQGSLNEPDTRHDGTELHEQGERAFCGGLNLALQWLPTNEGGEGWRDDVIEILGPAALELREMACEVSWRLGYESPPLAVVPPPEASTRTRVLAIRIACGLTSEFVEPI